METRKIRIITSIKISFLILMAMTSAVDLYTTYLGVFKYGAHEINPIARWFFTFGPIGIIYAAIFNLCMMGFMLFPFPYYLSKLAYRFNKRYRQIAPTKELSEQSIEFMILGMFAGGFILADWVVIMSNIMNLKAAGWVFAF